MTAVILDGSALARTLRQELEAAVAAFEAEQGWVPGIAVVQMGEDPASERYVRAIERTFSRVRMGCALHVLPLESGLSRLQDLLRGLNADPRTNGIIVQLPLPEPLAISDVTTILDPAKDVDGIHPLNAGKLMQGDPDAFVPATPAGGMEILRRYGVSLVGKRAVMVGRSNIVGRPMALLMLHEHATVTICHSRTPDLGAVTRQADVLVAAVGRPRMISAEMVKPGAVVIDFGVNVIEGQLVGDVDTEGAAQVAGHITPVPGGTGPMTNLMLVRNTLAAAKRQVATA